MTTYLRLPNIRTTHDLKVALDRIDEIIDAEEGTQEGTERLALSDLVWAFEERQQPIDAHPIVLLRELMKRETSHGHSPLQSQTAEPPRS
jgi:antitoxin component HigA of HigAB toxin-antitoxin module